MTLGFDDSYLGTPPWDIGRPQPAFERFSEGGGLRGLVLDVGCGTGEHALMAARLGFRAVGLDASPRAIERARSKAAGTRPRCPVRGRGRARHGGPRRTLRHGARLRAVPRVGRRRPGAVRRGPGRGESPGRAVRPALLQRSRARHSRARRISEEEIRSSFTDGWRIVSIDPTTLDVLFTPDGIPAWCCVIERT